MLISNFSQVKPSWLSHSELNSYEDKLFVFFEYHIHTIVKHKKTDSVRIK